MIDVDHSATRLVGWFDAENPWENDCPVRPSRRGLFSRRKRQNEMSTLIVPVKKMNEVCSYGGGIKGKYARRSTMTTKREKERKGRKRGERD